MVVGIAVSLAFPAQVEGAPVPVEGAILPTTAHPRGHARVKVGVAVVGATNLLEPVGLAKLPAHFLTSDILAVRVPVAVSLPHAALLVLGAEVP